MIHFAHLASMDKGEGGSMLIVVGIILVIMSYVYPKNLPATWITTSGDKARFFNRITGFSLIGAGVLVLLLG